MIIKYLVISIIIIFSLLTFSIYTNLSLLEPLNEIIQLNSIYKDTNAEKVEIDNTDIKKTLFVTSLILNNVTTTEKNNIETLSPDDPKINEYFNKVAKVPFKANYTSNIPKSPLKFWRDNYGDCDDKSVAFADYLYNNGAKDLWIVTIEYESKYSHSCVMWHNRIYDPTATPPIYNVNKERYYNFLIQKGFRLWTANIYTPDYVTIRKKIY